MKVVIYIRYTGSSSAPGIEEQRNACRKYAAEQGYTILNEYVDCHSDSMACNCRSLDKMMRDSKERKFDGILAYSAYCFSWNLYELISYKIKSEKYGITLLSATEDQLIAPCFSTIERILQAYADYMYDEHSEKVKRGIQLAKERRAAQAAAEGKPVA